jgi:hypothetical protein
MKGSCVCLLLTEPGGIELLALIRSPRETKDYSRAQDGISED